ncbi:MAG: hypothetical protein EA351_08205 [Gemmatimonadales bacterium]|nr:MAG: hypothetical protein EA351_08205 [Gemmatimonadales bacterium]
MRMSSHYSPGRTRWVLAAIALVYALTAGLAPVAHFAEEAAEENSYRVALAEADGSQPEPSPPTHGPDELDCLFCQALTLPLQSPDASADLSAAPPSPLLLPGTGPALHWAATSTRGARAPPSV